MRKMLTNNLGLKLLSLGLALVLWLAILSIEDPVTRRDFTDIKVTEINAERLAEKGKTYSFSNGDSVSRRVEGKASIVGRLTAEDFEAVADMSKLTESNAVVVDVSCPNYPSVEITPIGSSNILAINIETIVEKSLSVRIVTTGDPATTKYIGTGTAAPNLVTVSGPSSEVGKVKEAVAYVPVNFGVTSDINTNTQLVLLDTNGNEISSSTLKCSQSNIHVTVPVYSTKTVPILFDVTGEAADGHQVMSVAYEPREVTLAGKDDALAQISEVRLQDYDLTDQKENVELTLPIASNLAEALPDGVILKDNDVSVAIAVTIEPIQSVEITVPFSKIQLKGTDEAYSYTLNTENNARYIRFSASGVKSVVSDAASAMFSASVDVTGYDSGEFLLPVTITPPEGITVDETPEIVVTIAEE